MPQSRPNFDPATGDDTSGALRKLDNNCNDLDTRLVAVKTTADGASTAAGNAQTTATAANTLANTANTTANSALTKANAAIPKAGGATTGAITASVGAGLAFGSTGAAAIGGTYYSDYYQASVNAVSANIHMRMQCVDVNGGATYSLINTAHFDNTNADFRFQHNGIAQATTWQSTSDVRIKRNLVPLTDPLDKIDHLTGYEFYEKRISSGPLLDEEGGFVLDEDGNPKMGPGQYMATCGVLAQDVNSVLPAAIDNLGSGFDTDDLPIDNILGVNDAGLSALFVECIKAQKVQIADLLARVAALEAR